MNVVTVVIFGAGALLIYSGIKDRDPRDVVAEAIRGEKEPGSGRTRTRRRARDRDGRNAAPAPYLGDTDREGSAGV